MKSWKNDEKSYVYVKKTKGLFQAIIKELQDRLKRLKSNYYMAELFSKMINPTLIFIFLQQTCNWGGLKVV